MHALSLLHAHDRLGETPFWDAAEGRLYWIDIAGQRVHALRPGEPHTATWEVGEDIGFLFPIAGAPAFVAGLGDRLARVTLGANGRVTAETLDHPEPDRPNNRFNDGCVDGRGRLWCGTMDQAKQHPTGSLYCYTGLSRRAVAEGFIIPNGPAIHPSGTWLAFAATYGTPERPRGLYRAPIQPGGTLGPEECLADFRRRDGQPDGMTFDAEGRLYEGIFGAGCVRVFDEGGNQMDRIALPTDNPTRPCFGGKDLRTLYIPTDAEALSDAERAAQPEAGSLFVVEEAGTGQAGHAFRL